MLARTVLVLALLVSSTPLALAQPTAGKVRLGATVSGPKVSTGELAGKAVVVKLWGRH